MSNREFVHLHPPPLCKKCKVVLRSLQDLQKTRRKWWSNCQNCRTANTVKERKKRNAMATARANVALQSKRPSNYDQPPESSSRSSQAVKRHKQTGSISASSALNTSEIRNSVQHPGIEAVKQCTECNANTDLPWITTCGHHFCSTCHILTDICKACNKVITSYRYEPKQAPSAVETVWESLARALQEPLHECSVCGEHKPSSELVELEACAHEPDTCTDCFRGWITSQFETSVQDGIRCPSITCGHKLTHADIKKHASSEDFSR